MVVRTRLPGDEGTSDSPEPSCGLEGERVPAAFLQEEDRIIMKSDSSMRTILFFITITSGSFQAAALHMGPFAARHTVSFRIFFADIAHGHIP